MALNSLNSLAVPDNSKPATYRKRALTESNSNSVSNMSAMHVHTVNRRGGTYCVAEHSMPAGPHKTLKWPCMMSLKKPQP